MDFHELLKLAPLRVKPFFHCLHFILLGREDEAKVIMRHKIIILHLNTVVENLELVVDNTNLFRINFQQNFVQQVVDVSKASHIKSLLVNNKIFEILSFPIVRS